MKIPDDLKADSGLKTHVRDAIRPHLDFIAACKADGISEAAIHRHLLKKGHKVGSRSGFGAALKYLLKDEQSAGASSALAERSSLSAPPLPPHSSKPAAIAETARAGADAGADAGAAKATMPAARTSINTAYAEHRVQPTFGGH